MSEQRLRTALEDLTAGPVTLLITGGIGMGKTTALETVRRGLREAGRTVVSAAPPGGESDAAVVVDDAHLLSPAELRRLTDLAADPDVTVVVAAEPREHDPDLRRLTAVMERERARITLAPLASADAVTFAETAGIPLLVAASTAHRTVPVALAERLRRLPEQELEALLVTTLGTDLGAADLAAALGVATDAAFLLVDRARATGLAEPAQPPEFRQSVHQAAAQILGAARHHEIESALLRTQLAAGTLSADLALQLAEHGLRDAALAEPLRWAAAAHPHDHCLRARILQAAHHSGAPDVRPALAEALALCGRCPEAADLADALLGAADPAERAAGVRVAAALAAHDGNIAQAADLFGWLGPYPDTPTAAAAVIAHLGCGDAAGARTALAAEHAGPPTAAARAARGLADGLLLTVDGPYPAAAVKLGQAAAANRAAGVAPDSTAALVTLAALHNGDAPRARSVITRAVAAGVEPLFRRRHRLLHGWIRMQDGQLSAAAADADAATADPHRRDALWAAALRTAVARRGGDAGAVQRHWYEGMEALAEYAVDLYSLLPLGELWMAAARLRQADRMAPFLDQAVRVLAALGDPPAWSLPLHWAGVHAGILGNDPAAVAPHGQALAAAAAGSPFAAALAAAGRTWLRVLARRIDPDEVIAAARGLAGFGLSSDATRLAGQAALSAGDPKVSALMLQIARDLKVSVDDGVPGGSAGPAASARGPAAATLSDREREVAELLLLGMPYRDIGAQLFISAKTVEHHVARIRRRLGAQSRSELLSMVRALLGDGAAGPTG